MVKFYHFTASSLQRSLLDPLSNFYFNMLSFKMLLNACVGEKVCSSMCWLSFGSFFFWRNQHSTLGLIRDHGAKFMI